MLLVCQKLIVASGQYQSVEVSGQIVDNFVLLATRSPGHKRGIIVYLKNLLRH
jgi:hypothetical protein